jgi:hypothetical protein
VSGVLSVVCLMQHGCRRGRWVSPCGSLCIVLVIPLRMSLAPRHPCMWTGCYRIKVCSFFASAYMHGSGIVVSIPQPHRLLGSLSQQVCVCVQTTQCTGIL